jgi:alanine racemase
MGLTKEEIEARGHPVWAEIDLDALRHNVGVLCDLAGGAEVMGVVKGYAYGHGNPACAQAMLQGGATRLGVARVAEALHLRDQGIEAPIHVFTEPPLQAVKAMIERKLIPTLYTAHFAEALSDAATAAGVAVPVHVKLDTGMHRVGVEVDEAPDLVARWASLKGIEIEGVWSHLAVADVLEHPFTRKQLELFAELVGRIQRAGIDLRFRHIANSAASLSIPEARYELVRCGIASYGLWPGADFVGTADLNPVLSLRARTNLVKTVAAGEGLSYGLDYKMSRRARVATVPVGYADGYDRRLSGRGEVLIRGARYRVSGTVCMDQFMVDVGDSDVHAGDIVTLIGRDGDERITAEEVAGHVGTINYEITTRIPSRVPRVYVSDDEPPFAGEKAAIAREKKAIGSAIARKNK